MHSSPTIIDTSTFATHRPVMNVAKVLHIILERPTCLQSSESRDPIDVCLNICASDKPAVRRIFETVCIYAPFMALRYARLSA